MRAAAQPAHVSINRLHVAFASIWAAVCSTQLAPEANQAIMCKGSRPKLLISGRYLG